MNPYDQISHLQSLQTQLGPLRHLWESSSIKVLEAGFSRSLGALGLSSESVENLRSLDVYRHKLEASQLGGLSGAVVTSAINSALAQIEQSKKLLASFEFLPSLESTRQILNAYQRPAEWMTPAQALRATRDRWTEPGSYRSLTAVADPLRLYRESMESLNALPGARLSLEIREMLQALESIGRDVANVGFGTGSSDLRVEDEDLSRLSYFSNGAGDTSVLSTENILSVVRQAISMYQELSPGPDKQIFATYIYPAILALIFSFINSYADFFVKQRLELANKTSEKAIQMSARESGMPAQVIEKFRFVKAQRLNVHKNGRMNSPMVGLLEFGQPVEVLKRDGDWTLVHYSDPENDTVIQGWVLSRYLKRYK
jgi:hypothetical protein